MLNQPQVSIKILAIAIPEVTYCSCPLAPTFSSGGGLVAPSVPPGPVGPPTLTPALCDNRPGCYSVDLETAQPTVDETISTSDIPPVAFLFRIESVASSNVNYIWLVSVVRVWRVTAKCQSMDSSL